MLLIRVQSFFVPPYSRDIFLNKSRVHDECNYVLFTVVMCITVFEFKVSRKPFYVQFFEKLLICNISLDILVDIFKNSIKSLNLQKPA